MHAGVTETILGRVQPPQTRLTVWFGVVWVLAQVVSLAKYWPHTR